MDPSAPDPRLPAEMASPERSPSPELPLTMSASAMLTAQPRDVAAALASAGGFPQDKVVVNFRPIGSAPALARATFQVSATQKFDFLVVWLRKKLKLADTDSVFLYVGQSFAPSLEEVIGNLHRVSALLASPPRHGRHDY